MRLGGFARGGRPRFDAARAGARHSLKKPHAFGEVVVHLARMHYIKRLRLSLFRRKRFEQRPTDEVDGLALRQFVLPGFHGGDRQYTLILDLLPWA